MKISNEELAWHLEKHADDMMDVEKVIEDWDAAAAYCMEAARRLEALDKLQNALEEI